MSPRETSLMSAEATWLSETCLNPRFARDLGDHAFVRRIAIGVHEHDRDGVIALSARFRQRGAHAFRIWSDLDSSVRAHALVDLDDAGIELLGLYDVLREYARARLVADLERIAKAARGHEQRALAPALEQRIGGDRCPHLDGADDPAGIGSREPRPKSRRIASTAASV